LTIITRKPPQNDPFISYSETSNLIRSSPLIETPHCTFYTYICNKCYIEMSERCIKLNDFDRTINIL